MQCNGEEHRVPFGVHGFGVKQPRGVRESSRTAASGGKLPEAFSARNVPGNWCRSWTTCFQTCRRGASLTQCEEPGLLSPRRVLAPRLWAVRPRIWCLPSRTLIASAFSWGHCKNWKLNTEMDQLNQWAMGSHYSIDSACFSVIEMMGVDRGLRTSVVNTQC